jgi:hypothetical protein
MVSSVLNSLFSVVGVLIFAVVLYWAIRPSDALKTQISNALEAKGLILLGLNITVGGDRSETVYAARARNPFGNVETHRFAVSRWGNMTSKNPVVREI